MSGEELPEERGEGDAAQLAAESVTDLVDRNRVQQIFKARIRCRQAFQNAELMEAQSRSPGHVPEVSRGVASAVDGYLVELEPLVEAAGEDVVSLYWEEAPLGTMYVSPPSVDEDDRRSRHRQGTKVMKVTNPDGTTSKDPQPVVKEFTGLYEYLNASPPFSYEWQYSLKTRHRGDEDRTLTEHRPLPREVSRSAYRVANRFCASVNLDLQLEERTPEVRFDYTEPPE